MHVLFVDESDAANPAALMAADVVDLIAPVQSTTLEEDDVIIHAKTLEVGDVLRPMSYWGPARYVVTGHDRGAKHVTTEKVQGDLSADEHALEFKYDGSYHWVVRTGRGALV